jgi:transcriptional regulator with XRE-family HTH domain
VTDLDFIGQSVARERKLAGKTQEQLANLTHYSLSYVKKVEQGVEPASPGFLAQVCKVLNIEPDVITGIPYRDENEPPLQGVAELQNLLAEGRYVRTEEPGSLDELSTALNTAHVLYYQDKGKNSLVALPALIRRIYGATEMASGELDRMRAYSLLTTAYYLAERTSRRFGYRSLVTPVIDRMEWAASATGNSLYTAQALTQRAHALMYYGDNDAALRLVERAVDMVEDRTEGGVCVLGAAKLAGAVISARAMKPDVARDYIAEARRLAEQVRGESSLYGTLFGKGNVEIHSVATLLESGDPFRAAKEGTALRFPPGVAAPRKGHHYQDLARAWVLAGSSENALKALNNARRFAPEQTRAHPQVRETARAIAALEKRKTDSLRVFTGWLGIQV